MVVVLTILTLGVYALIWNVKTKREMVSRGADIPTCWLLFLPIGNVFWLWKWSGGIEKVTGAKMTTGTAFLLSLFLPLVSMAIIQDALNKAIDQVLPHQLPEARIA